MKPREPAREPPAPEEVSELLLDKARQSLPVAHTRGICAKRLEVLVHNLVERTLRGVARFVGRGGRRHARSAGGRRASKEPDKGA